MAHPFSRLVQELKKLQPEVHSQFADDWGARNFNARTAIRTSIKNSFPKLSKADLSLVEDLDHHPRPYVHSVSISHTEDFGGWIAVVRPAQIGWDVELKARIKARVIERVCAPDEIKNAPNPAFLWSAKEAYFKALEDDQPEVLSQLTIAEWQLAGADLWTWRGLGPRNGEGLLLDADPWVFAACLIR